MTVLEIINTTTGLEKKNRKKEIMRRMIENGQQIPLNKLLSAKEILGLEIKYHVIQRYKQRFSRMYDIEIETMIKRDLLDGGVIVDDGHTGRFKVSVKGVILVMDEQAIYTTYTAEGKNRNNIIDPAEAQLKKIKRKVHHTSRIDELFSQISAR